VSARHFIASGPYNCPQNAPSYLRNSVQLVEVSDGVFHRLERPTGRLRVTSLKGEPPLRPGYKRVYEQCKQCGRVMFRDFVPFSLENPIMTLPCGHGATQRHSERVRQVGCKGPAK
jgi:hypothetical protein